MVLPTIIIVAGIVGLSNLSAQTYDSNKSDFSRFSNTGQDITNFSISAEVVESSLAVDLFESAEVISVDGAHKKLGIMITPPRLIFTSDCQTAELTMTNIGESDTVYRIKLVNSIVDENGERTAIEKNSPQDSVQKALFADTMLKFAPRLVQLKPKEQQTIRVSVQSPKELSDGEYRSELHFTWLPDTPELADQQKFKEYLAVAPASATNTNIGTAVLSKEIYVPLLVRKGQLAATAQLVELQLESSEKSTRLNLKVRREGNCSISGDLVIYGLNPQQERTSVLQTVRNIAVYPPTQQRILSVDVSDAISNASDTIDSLMIEYKSKKEENSVMASATIKLLIDARVSAD